MKKTSAKDVYTLADLQKWPETVRGIKPPIRLGVFGDPVAHSLSPQMQNAALRERGIARQCAREKCEPLVIANRTFEKAKQLVKDLADFFVGPKVLGPVPRLQAIPWDERAFEFQIANIDLIVNATPLGLKRSDPSPLAARLLAPHLMVYDSVYSDGPTPFTAAAAEAGARAASGLSMLLHQGARSFEIWFKSDAPLDVMRDAL